MKKTFLTRASFDIVPDILNILLKKWPDTKTSYNTLRGYYELKTKFPERKDYLLTPEGKVDEFGTFILIIPGIVDIVYVETLNPDESILTKALVDCIDINWNSNLTIETIHERHATAIENICNFLQLKIAITTLRSYHLESNKAKEITYKLPDNVFLDNLSIEDAITINTMWPHGSGDSTLHLVKEYIMNRKSFGLYKKDDKTLIGWCLLLEFVGPALLQVIESEKGKGYGEILLRAITKYIGESGADPHAFIVVNNNASLRLFNKLGYKPYYHVKCYDFSPA